MRTTLPQVDPRRLPLFEGIGPDDARHIQSQLRVRAVERHETVLQKGGEGDGLLFLISGRLEVNDTTEDGRTLNLRTLQEGDFFGEIAVITGSRRSASVVAQTRAVVAFLPAAPALHAFSHHPVVAQNMLRHLARKIQQDSQLRSLLSIQSTTKRIYAYLQQRAESADGGSLVVQVLPSHQDIANLLNTSRESVTRALSQLVADHVAVKDGHTLRIVDPIGLKHRARS